MRKYRGNFENAEEKPEFRFLPEKCHLCLTKK